LIHVKGLSREDITTRVFPVLVYCSLVFYVLAGGEVGGGGRELGA
jgi:hypothetical protein